MSRPLPVSMKDFRLERTVGHPLLTPFAMPLPAIRSSWVTVSLTISSYSTISKVTRLWLAGSAACEALVQEMTRRVGGETSKSEERSVGIEVRTWRYSELTYPV